MQKKSFRQGLVSVLSGQALIYVLSLIQVPWLTRHLSPDGFGIFSFSVLLFSFGLNFILYGVNNSGVFLFRKHFNSPLRRSLVFWNQLAAQVILAVIASIILGLGLLASSELGQHADVYALVGLSFVTNALYNPWILVATERFRLLSSSNVAMRAGSLILIVLLVHDQGDVFKAVLALVLPAVLATLIFLWWCFSKRIIQPVPLRMINPARVLRRDAFIAASGYAVLLNSYAGVTLAKFLLNDHDYGLLSFGDRFRWISMMTVMTVGNVLFSRYCGERLESVERGARFGRKSLTLLTGAGLALAIAVAAAVHPLTLLLGGREFMPAEPVVLLVAVAVPFYALNHYLTTFVINVFGMASRQLTILLATSALIVSGILLVPSPTAVSIMAIITAGEIARTIFSLLIIRAGGYRPFHPGLKSTLLRTGA